MLLAQAAFFPPWYFWLFVFAVVSVVVTGFVTMVVSIKRAEFSQRIKEREIAARLIERMLAEQRLSPEQIDQVLNSYWRLGSFWGRFRHLWPAESRSTVDIPQQKSLAHHSARWKV